MTFIPNGLRLRVIVNKEDNFLSFDGIFTHVMVQQLQQKLTNGRVMKIQQPYPNELIMTIRAQRHNYPILLSAHPQYARVQITTIPYANPDVPTKFTMSLRKYLAAATLRDISQADNDRVIHLMFSTRDELGDQQNLELIVEMMGRHSNIILINTATNKIIDLIRHVPADQNRYRLLMPGATYVTPPDQHLINPFEDDNGSQLATITWDADAKNIAKQLQHHYQGLGKDSAYELATRLLAQRNNDDELTVTWQQFWQAIAHHPQPTITIDEQGNASFSPIPYLSMMGTQTTFTDASVMLDHFYADKAERDRVKQQGAQLIHTIKTHLEKDYKKQTKLQQTLDETEKADFYRIRGEILTTYLSKIKRGMTSITLPNFYDNEQPVTIALSNQLSPSKNAQHYFARYQKLKNAISYVNEQMRLNQNEINYLEGILTEIDLADPKDLVDIKTELEQEGYLRKQHKNRKKRQTVSKPDTFYASDGTIITVGKNNLQNERLTLKTARKDDIWLHAKNIPGSHVIISSNKPSEQALKEAAILAAYFSKSRLSATIPVDYIMVKKIHKPSGTKPGFVTYTGQHTIYVTPQKDIVEKLRHKPTI